MFTPDQKTELGKPLSRSAVKSRKQGGRQVSYVEGWHAIAEANRIFGFDGWSRETVDLKCVAERERAIGDSKASGWGVSYIAKVRICVVHPGPGAIVREGCGTGHGIDRDLGQAHESALKEAETDAMKRALMTFGNPFGLALYDKTQENVADDDSMPGKSKFIEDCKTKIVNSVDVTALLAWWSSDDQKQARRDFELTQAEVDDLKTLIAAKRAKAA